MMHIKTILLKWTYRILNYERKSQTSHFLLVHHSRKVYNITAVRAVSAKYTNSGLINVNMKKIDKKPCSYQVQMKQSIGILIYKYSIFFYEAAAINTGR